MFPLALVSLAPVAVSVAFSCSYPLVLVMSCVDLDGVGDSVV